jgi:hypothetical protein
MKSSLQRVAEILHSNRQMEVVEKSEGGVSERKKTAAA